LFSDVVTEILLFDFVLFIGERYQLPSGWK
jgi:hypothetical protein